MECHLCKGACIKRGLRNSVQQYFCKSCKKYQRETYRNYRVNYCEVQKIILLNNEGMGISSIARLLKRTKSTIIRYVRAIERICGTEHFDNRVNQEYELDEMLTFIGRKEMSSKYMCWIMYAIERTSRKPVSFYVGRRSKESLRSIVQPIESHMPASISTDRLNLYLDVIDPHIHTYKDGETNHIERKNLTLRTHLKRLSRRTICFSRSQEILTACVSIYFTFKEWNMPLPINIGVNEESPSFRIQF